MNRLAFAAALAWLGAAHLSADEPAAERRVRPVAVLLDNGGGASLRRAGSKASPSAHPGEAFFPGDTLMPGAVPALMLYCVNGTGRVVEYRAPVVIADGKADGGRATPGRCLFPLVDRGGAVADPSRIASPEEKSDPPIAGLPAVTNEADLHTLLTRVTMFQEAGHVPQTIRELRRLLQHFPEAAWAKRLMETEAARVVSTGTQPQTEAPKERTYALLLGISEYQNPAVSWLNYAHDDAALFGKYLESKRGGNLRPCPAERRGVPSEDCEIRTLVNQQATAAAIDAALDDLFLSRGQEQDKQTTLIIFVAGHGFFPCLAKDPKAPFLPGCSGREGDKQTFLLSHDSNPEDPKAIGYSFFELTERLIQHTQRYRKVLVYLDVCHAGVVPWFANDIVPPANTLSEAQKPSNRLGLLTASSRRQEERDKEFAYESPELQHGVFTFYLVWGLAGGAPERSNKTMVFDGLSTWVALKVNAATDGAQTPQGKAESTLTVVDNTAAEVFRFPEKEPQTVVVRMDRRPAARALLPPPPNRGMLLAQLRREASNADAASRKRLEVVLEDAGNQVIYDYLQGDQVPQAREAFQNCAAYFSEAAELAPERTRHEARMLFCRARAALFDKSRYAEALPLLDRAIRLDPDRAYAFNALGLAHLEQVSAKKAEPALAIAAFEEAIQLAPYWAYPRHNLALTYALIGDNDAAIRTYTEAMRVRPDYSYLPYNLGLLYQKLNMREEAVRSLRLAVRLAEAQRKRMQQAPQRWTERASAYSAIGTLQTRRRTALAYYEKALADDPDYLPASHNKALLLANSSREQEAIGIWEKVLAADGDFTAARLSLAETFLRMGELSRAIAEYRELLRRQSKYVAGRRALAAAEAQQGDYTSASAELKIALDQSEDQALRAEIQEEKDDVERLERGVRPRTAQYRDIWKRRLRNP